MDKLIVFSFIALIVIALNCTKNAPTINVIGSGPDTLVITTN
jgi:hypothetical protein